MNDGAAFKTAGHDALSARPRVESIWRRRTHRVSRGVPMLKTDSMTYASNQKAAAGQRVRAGGCATVHRQPSCDSDRSVATELLRAKSLRPGSGAGMQSVSLLALLRDFRKS
jgi:hypothetical protein